MYTVTFQMRCTSVLKKNGTRGFGSNSFKTRQKLMKQTVFQNLNIDISRVKI